MKEDDAWPTPCGLGEPNRDATVSKNPRTASGSPPIKTTPDGTCACATDEASEASAVIVKVPEAARWGLSELQYFVSVRFCGAISLR